MKMKKENTGITLIALIITIIVLIIIAGITINLTIGENSIIKQAQKSNEEYIISSIREEIEIEILSLDMDKASKGEKLTVEQALNEIQEKGIFEEIDLIESTGLKQGYVIELEYNENGKVVISRIEKDTGVRIISKLNPKDYTNGKVEVQISVKSNEVNVVNIQIPEGMTLKAENIYEIEKNGNYLVKANLENGETIEKEIKIKNIDKLPPKSFTIAVETKETGIVIQGQTEDEDETNENAQSGIDYYEYYVNDEKKVSNEINGLAYGTYKVYMLAFDKAGNSCKSEEIEVKISRKIEKVSAGVYHSLAIDSEGNLWTWGINGQGQIGDGTTTSRPSPVQIKPDKKFTQISAGNNHNLAIDAEGNLWAWGENNYGQIGDGTTTNKTSLVQIKPNTKFTQIAAGSDHSLAIDEEGNLWAWGRNEQGQVGNGKKGAKEYESTPVQITNGVNIQFSDISAGHYSSLALDNDKNLWGWGWNGWGQLGNGTTTDSAIPIQIKEGVEFKNIFACRATKNILIDVNGKLWASGIADNGIPDTYNASTKYHKYQTNLVQTHSEYTFKQISHNGSHILFIDIENNLYAMGSNNSGQLGNGTTTDSSVLIPVKEENKFKFIATGSAYSLAIDENSNLWAWGSNNFGQLGDGTRTDKTSPIQIF